MGTSYSSFGHLELAKIITKFRTKCTCKFDSSGLCKNVQRLLGCTWNNHNHLEWVYFTADVVHYYHFSTLHCSTVDSLLPMVSRLLLLMSVHVSHSSRLWGTSLFHHSAQTSPAAVFMPSLCIMQLAII